MTVVRDLDADVGDRCLRALGATGAALAGDDPEAVLATLRVWRAERAPRWPWLPGLCWSALAPLGVAFPEHDDHAVTVGRFLTGEAVDAGRLAAALAALRAIDVPAPATVRGGGQARAALAAAVDGFWAELLRTMRHVHTVVRGGDAQRAGAYLRDARGRLQRRADRVAGLAQELAGGAGAATADEAALSASGPMDEPLEQTGPMDGPLEQIGPMDAPEGLGSGDGALGSTWGPAATPRSRRETDEVEYVTVREHPLAPLVYVLLTCLGAIVWLVMVSSG